jgi:hypothetical protein
MLRPRRRPECFSTLWVAALGAVSGCVPGVPHFVTAAESRAGHPYEDAEYGSADLALQAVAPPAAEPGAPETVATAGYWHWNGLAYERVPGGREARSAPYLWRWKDDPPR